MIKSVIRKSLKIRYSGRSSDYITPSFGYGCLYKCAYCYMRRHVNKGLTIATNTDDIINSIYEHVNTLGVKKPNQTHNKYWTYDLSCNEDFALHAKYHDCTKIFNFFKNNDNVFGTFATKNVNNNLLNFNPLRKIRIRFSLMPQELSNILEPNTSLIIDRIKAINTFYEAGYDVHINFSPVIILPHTKKLYEELFNLVNDIVLDEIKPYVLSEVILLTHNKKMHEYNLIHNPEAEELLWQPDKQESKVSSYGSENLRYKWQNKNKYVDSFKKLHNSIIPWNQIRYIF